MYNLIIIELDRDSGAVKQKTNSQSSSTACGKNRGLLKRKLINLLWGLMFPYSVPLSTQRAM